MNLNDLEQELQRLLRACEGLDDAKVLDVFEVAIGGATGPGVPSPHGRRRHAADGVLQPLGAC
jgi:hypothetical protein